VALNLPKPNGGFEWTQAPWGRALRCRGLLLVVPHLFTTRDLDLARGFGQTAGWDRVAESVGVPAHALVRPRQVHGTAVLDAGRQSAIARWENEPPPADIIVTDDPDLAVAVQVADCVPLLVADARTGAVAAGHSGWRGTAAEVATVLVAAMQSRFGARSADLIAAIGPSIGPCCYTVGASVLDAFSRQGHPPGASSRWFRRACGLRLDLWRANRDQLENAGIRPERIHVCELCTACHADLFPSYRRDGPETGRIAAAIRPPRPTPVAG